MSDISILAQQVALFLTPFVPYLIKGGIEAAKGAAGKVGELATEKGWNTARSMWGKLSKHEEVNKAAEMVAILPNDADAQAALRLQIKLALKADTALVEELERLIAETTKKGTVNAGSRFVVIGGNAKDSVIITGDQNKVEK